MNVLFSTHEIRAGALNAKRGELMVCSVETQELQSSGNFSTNLSMHRTKKSYLKHNNKAFTAYFKLYKLFSVTLPSMHSMRSFKKQEPQLYTKFLKIEKSENPTQNLYSLHFLFLLPLTITYLLFRGRWTG